MIEAKDLRIGNKFHGIAGVQTVKSIQDNTPKSGFDFESQRLRYSHLILCEEKRNQYKPFEIKPIPLTEEWLLNFGLKKGGSSLKIKTPNNVKCCITFNIDGVLLLEYDEFVLPLKKIKFVHKFQNIVFELTGKELKYNK